MLPWWSIVLGTTVLVWKITSQGLRFYSYCCNADPCMGIAYTNWLCCHDSLGGTSLVWWISSQACSSSSFQSADDHIEVVKMCWHRYEDRVNICTRRRGVSSWICRYFSSLIVFALCKPYWIVELVHFFKACVENVNPSQLFRLELVVNRILSHFPVISGGYNRVDNRIAKIVKIIC